MGEHGVSLLPRDIVFNGLLGDDVANVTRVLDTERWLMAEKRIADLLDCIQPNVPSEELRNAVVHYVQRLITNCFSCEVFVYGSVPLKTYLPDGDIDLTVLSKNGDLKDACVIKVRNVLENEEKSENAEFHVKEVQYIQAEVKIIKCLVENIVVDISFNQVGGLCTLYFLQEIDNLISLNHLFKRSIILIKAWCYYESRILGAHHGLISTYALETLILYIFHVFSYSLTGPLEVLYRFLEFFSRFNWDNFCVSLWGPVPISSLPDMTAEFPRKDGVDLLLSGRFLKDCTTRYAVLPNGQESQGQQCQQFVPKHFNVIDPLRTNNNLGRSVSKGNFYRIRSAFSFGAKRLARLLDCPKEDLIAEVNQFFMNTWQRRGSTNQPDAPVPAILYSQPVKDGPADESSHSRVSANLMKSTEYFPNACKTTKSFIDSHSSSQKFCPNRTGSSDFDHMERTNSSNQDGQASSSFAMTQSISALAETPTDDHSRTRHDRVVEAGGSRRKNTNIDVSNIQMARVSLDVAPQSSSVSIKLQQQEQEEMVNNIVCSQAPNFIGQGQVPLHFASPHPPLPPFLTSMGYGQRNLVTIVDPSLGSTMPFPQGFISSQPPQYISNVDTLNSNFEELIVNETPCVPLLNQESRSIGSTRDLITDTGEFQMLPFDERQHPSEGHFNYALSSKVSNNWDKNPSTSEVENSTLEKEQSEWEFEVASTQEDDESGNWISTMTSATSMSEHTVSYAPLAPSHSRNQFPGYYSRAHIRGANSMIPFAPVLLGDSRQKMVDGSGALPFSFYPTGPPVPFLSMVPAYNFPADRGILYDSINHVENYNCVRHFQASPSCETFNPAENYDQFDHPMNLSISEGATLSSSEEHRPDVLNSDFDIHWQNFQYGRLCQNTRSHGPFMYFSPFLVPPAYLHGHLPMDGSGRSYSANMNFTQITGYTPRLVPVTSLHPGSCRPYGFYNRYRDESQRYQGGTGTYLPSPASFRERQFSNGRNQRGGYRHDRGDHTDRERTRINSMARSPGRYQSSN